MLASLLQDLLLGLHLYFRVQDVQALDPAFVATA